VRQGQGPVGVFVDANCQVGSSSCVLYYARAGSTREGSASAQGVSPSSVEKLLDPDLMVDSASTLRVAFDRLD
jgi:hypothetical protein